MSDIDLSNPKVLKNYLLGMMREGRGNFSFREKVLVFRDVNGNEYLAPEELLKETDVVKKETEEVLIEAPAPEPVVDKDTGKVTPKKKKKLLV